jgi:hypothetical protein
MLTYTAENLLMHADRTVALECGHRFEKGGAADNL